jgi:hypothetical protein
MPDQPNYGATFWDQRYGAPDTDYIFGTAPNDFLAACADQLPAGLAKAQRLASRTGVDLTTTVADLTDFAFGHAEWSVIVSIFCHLAPDLRKTVHARAAAGLRPGGMVVLEAYAPGQVQHRTGGPLNSPDRLMALDEVRHDFPGIEWIIAREIERDVIEGTGHTGRAAVTQILGRRTP